MKIHLIGYLIVAAMLVQSCDGFGSCVDTSIKALKQNPGEFHGEAIAVYGLFNFSPHGMTIADLDNDYSAIRLNIPPDVWKLPIVDALKANLFRTKLGIYKKKITGVFCGAFDQQTNSLTLIDIISLTIQIPRDIEKRDGN